jgi:anti-sigma factor RsiW
MIEEHWTERLSEYLDGELEPGERAAAEGHLSRCAECADVLADLRAVMATTALLPDTPPERDLWPGIRERLTGRVPEAAASPRVIALASRRRVVLSVPQLIAAGLALMLVSAAGMWITLGGAPPDQAPVAEAAWHSDVVLTAYEPAMADLEAEYLSRRELLEPETILVVERNLALIDAAIQEARDALAADPSNGFLNGHLAETVRRRMSLLRQVASI